MTLRTFMIAALTGLLAASAATAQTHAPASGTPASIPLVRLDNIRDFKPDRDRGVWLQDRRRNWYYASMVGPCIGLPNAMQIAVDTRFGGNSLDSTGILLVDGQRCHIGQLTTSDAPPKRAKAK